MTRPIASRVCPECTAERPLKDFRRWHGAHRTLHEVCNVCRPEKKLNEMSDREREAAIALRQPERYARERAERAAQYRKKLRAGDAMRRTTHIRKLERIRNWNAAIGDAVREELETAIRKRDAYQNLSAVYNDPNPKYPPSRAQVAARMRFGCWAADTWLPFYSLYVEILTRVKDVIKSKAHTLGAPIKPTEEETKLETYITPEEIIELKDRYSKGAVIPGVRHRIPWVVNGQYALVKQKTKRGQVSPLTEGEKA